MVLSTVRVSMSGDNGLDCSYAIVEKGGVSVILVLRQAECAIFDYEGLRGAGPLPRYLLLKHYPDPALAYRDFLKLIGKMCKKHPDSKYFRHRVAEDNRMVAEQFGAEHAITEGELPIYRDRLSTFEQFVSQHRTAF